MTIAKRSAFTMMEMMVVLSIIGMIAALMGPRIMRYMSEAKISSTKATMSTIKGALMEYSIHVGHLPKSLDGLKENIENSKRWKGPYFAKEFEDGWNNEIIYNRPPQVYTKDYRKYELISYGELGEGSDQSEWVYDGM